MSYKQRMDFGFEIKAVGEDGTFSGYGSIFGVKDSAQDIVVRGAFDKSLAEWKAAGRMPPMLWQHRMDEPVGIYTRMEEDDRGLYLEGRLLIDADPLAKRAHAHMKAGSISGLSIGYTLPKDSWHWDKDKQAYILKEIKLWEVSVVTFPANDAARVQTVKSALAAGEAPDERTLEAILRDAGMSRNQAKAMIAGGYRAIGCRDGGDTDDAEIKAALMARAAYLPA